MRPGPRRSWSFLAVAVVVLALGGGGIGASPHRLIVTKSVGLIGRSASAGAVEAVLVPETDRVESALTVKSSSAGGLILQLAAAFAGLALLLLPTPARRHLGPIGPPPLSLLRHWVGRRAPPSSLLVSLTH
jgi:hypothetical protein